MLAARHFILFLLLTGITLISSSQGKKPIPFKRCSVKTINFEQGLLNNYTTNILTDVLGFTWMSTVTGMQRFNGYNLENIQPVINKESININYPVFFFGLQDGSIWISYKEGVLSYNPVSNSFSKVISFTSTGNSYYSIIPLQETKEGIWCMQEKKGIVIYNPQGIVKKIFPSFNKAWSDSIVRSQGLLYKTISAGNDNFIFIYNFRNQVLQINTKTNQFDYMNYELGAIYGLTCNRDKLFIVSAMGLSSIDIASRKIIKTIPFKEFTNESIRNNSLLLVDNTQLLLTVNNHLYEFDTSCVCQKEFTTLSRNPVVPTGEIEITYADKFKRIWLLTNDDIKRIENVNIPFEHFLYPNEKNNFVRCVYYDEQKHFVLAGCYDGSIQLYDTLANPLWPKPLIIHGTGAMYILGIEKLTPDDYLVETYDRAWYLLNLPSKQLRPFHMAAAVEAKLHHAMSFGNNIQRINDSTLFIATSANVFRCVFKNFSLQSFQPVFPFARDTIDFLNCFVYTSDKTLWATTRIGLLYRLDSNGSLQTVRLPDNYIMRCITEDARHNIWVGTDKGLYVYSLQGRLIRKITRETGLLNDCIYALLPVDGAATVFASSNLGISRVSADGTLNNYSRELGLQENEFNTGAAVKTLSGKFYFGGVNGITSFYPATLNVLSDTPIINITRLVVNDSLYNSSAGIWKGDSILLQHHQNHLQLDFAAMGLLNNNEYLYKYRLKGFEEAWQSTYQPTGIRYILEPGHYTLEIRCSPILATNSVYTKKIIIIIYPPWWQTWWFMITAGIIAIVLIAFLIQQYNRRKYTQKIRALQLQQDIQSERERISRDLHDNIGAYASAMSADIETIGDKHSPGEKVVQNLKHNVHEIITSLRETIWALSRESITVTGISDRFKNYINKIMPSYPSIKVQFREDIHTNKTLKPVHALNIFRIMQEAFHNAIRHSQGHSIIIHIDSNNQLTISIEDDGIGINDNDLNSDHGLRNMQVRAKETGLTVNISPAVGNRGTKVTITDATIK